MRTWTSMAIIAIGVASFASAQSDGETNVDDIDIDPAEIDYSITEATDFKNNRAEKMDYNEFSFDDFQLIDMEVRELMELAKDDEQFSVVVAAFKDQFVEYYQQQVALLNPVCEGGQECRNEIKTELKTQIFNEVQEAVLDIKVAIEDASMSSRNYLSAAYKDAYYCDHGCQCQFVETTYSGLISLIEDHQQEIDDWSLEITELQAKIDSVPYECEADFAGIEEEYNTKWGNMAVASKEQIVALDDWTEDGFELEDAVDQKQFEAEFGFKYDSSRFDRFYEDEDYYYPNY